MHDRSGQGSEVSARPSYLRLLLVGAALAQIPLILHGGDIPAPTARLAPRALLLDVASAGPRLIAVGVHGVIITSDDDGANWSQASVPVSTMLTCVAFADDNHGWAGGHAGVLLGTQDGGRTWSRLSIETTADDSFLVILPLPGGRLLASGAYGLYFVSNDSGATWNRETALDEDVHINRLTRGTSGTVYLAAEAGTLAVSQDGGASWQRLESPYEGSFYGLLELADGSLLAYGLRGHVFSSIDHGTSWTQIPIDHTGLLATAAETPSGVVVISGAGGQLFLSRDHAILPGSPPTTGLKSTADLVMTRSGRLICVGDAGVVSVAIPQP